MSPQSPHDKLWRSALANPKDAAATLCAVLSVPLARQLDWSTLEPLPGTFVDEAMRASQADRLYSVRRRRGEEVERGTGLPSSEACPSKGQVLLYLLMEHKSEVDRWTLLQLLRYMVRIWEQCLAEKNSPSTLSPIIPVVFHHSETGWTASKHFQGLFDPVSMADAELRRLTPEFEVELDDISHKTDQELRARGMGPAATLDFLFLRDGRREGRVLEELVAWADLFRAVLALPQGQDAVVRLFSYLSRVAPNLGLVELAERVRKTIPETESAVMTLAEQLIEQGEKRGLQKGIEKGIERGIEKGIERGIEKGIERGIEKGYRAVVRRLIELKFGEVRGDALARLEAADKAALERFSERLLTATSVDEVLVD